LKFDDAHQLFANLNEASDKLPNAILDELRSLADKKFDLEDGDYQVDGVGHAKKATDSDAETEKPEQK